MQKHKSRGKKGSKGDKGTTEWVKRKKELYRTRGKADVPRDSKYVFFFFLLMMMEVVLMTMFAIYRYTARSRKPRF